jgi:hypothetical protein
MRSPGIIRHRNIQLKDGHSLIFCITDRNELRIVHDQGTVVVPKARELGWWIVGQQELFEQGEEKP